MEKLSFDRNIVQFYGAVLSAPAPMLVLEFMEGMLYALPMLTEHTLAHLCILLGVFAQLVLFATAATQQAIIQICSTVSKCSFLKCYRLVPVTHNCTKSLAAIPALQTETFP